VAKGQTKAKALRQALKEQGRTVQWLADEMGYSRGYVSNVLGGKTPFTDAFHEKALSALHRTAAVPVLYRGRRVVVPANIFNAQDTLPLIAVESAYEEAWKRAWLAEHGAATLAAAADRAWQVAQATNAA
jgi:transcriptional regulator with XRE-family HTH domain